MTDLSAQPGFSFAAPGRKAVGIWLLCVAAMVIAMVVVGGLTRLTGSGLSITEWDPIVGALPPLSGAAWMDAFHKYQQIPQYAHLNSGMSLDDFKGIFWWEWAHRFLGRTIGVVFFLPFLWFAWTGAIARKEWPRMIVLFLLGGLQGFVGWWMVESGLEFRDSVSQYRLAIHLGVAVLLLGALLWIALEYLRDPPVQKNPPVTRGLVRWSAAMIALIYIQMLLGALVAGLHAGLIYNNWPMMGWHWLPEGMFFNSPWWINFFENAGTVQFDHRMVAYAVMLVALPLSWRMRAMKPSQMAMNAGGFVFVLTLTQVLLGIVTLRTHVWVTVAALHQLTAALLFCSAVWLTFELRRLYKL